ncbi:hypothetical protein CJ030_MR3G011091 [Morella rubra]|uniref:Uncharacterized protein n=1 Tax=Morella rubra TaxID=262757 RepID=A0A6A1W307_9ROSI|nr:hypothetical protein CJ030_MR3G011091 [Morella rubra]
MVAQEPYQDPAGENSDLQDPYEAEDALSLCDLPIYGDTSKWEEYAKEDQRLSSDNEFEFLSEDFTASTCSTTENKYIIFCGKLIPYKELPDTEKTQNQESTNTKQNHKKKGFFRWKSLSFSTTESSSKRPKKKGKKYSKLQEDKDSNSLALPSSKGYGYEARKCDFSVGKVSMLSAPAKSRYLLMFGMTTRFPTDQTKLSDIRTRQSRMKSQSSMLRSVHCDEMVKDNGDERRGKGLWRLLRVLGHRSRHRNTVVKDCTLRVR